MEKQGFVSLWIGSMSSQEQLIWGCSYEEKVIDKFINMIGNKLSKEINSAILLYNFSYEDNPKKINNKEGFRYIGTVQYDRD